MANSDFRVNLSRVNLLMNHNASKPLCWDFHVQFACDYDISLHLHLYVDHVVEHVDMNKGNKGVIMGLILLKYS